MKTFDWQSINRDAWDVVVVGAGPAGSAAAITAVRSGLTTLLVDAKAFPRRKPCGGCLNQGSIEVLKRLLPESEEIWSQAKPLEEFELWHRHKRFRFTTPTGYAFDRAELDQRLVQQAIAEGATFAAPLALALEDPASSREHEGRRLREVGGERRTLVGRVVVLATGLGNRGDGDFGQVVASESRVGVESLLVDFPGHYAERRIHMVVGRDGYVGLTQVHGGRLHVAAAVAPDAVRGLGPEKAVAQILRDAGAPSLETARSANQASIAWKGTPALTAQAKRLAGHQVFLVGDAAGYVEPFTGEGVKWALQSGLGVGSLLRRGVQGWSRNLEHEWESWYFQNIGSQQRLCRRIAWTLKQPWMRWLAHQALTLRPELAEQVISELNSLHE